jgi:hypothetical protein
MAATAAYMDTASATAAAASAAMAAAAASAAMAATAASAAMAAATTGQFKLFGKRGASGIFLVEDIERRQADVREFLLAKKELVALGGRWCIRQCLAG